MEMLILNIFDAITEKVLKYLRDDKQQKKDFDSPDFISNDDLKPRIRIRYNPKYNKWEPVNFAKIRKADEELMRRLRGGVVS